MTAWLLENPMEVFFIGRIMENHRTKLDISWWIFQPTMLDDEGHPHLKK
jgi:hypothetical protein